MADTNKLKYGLKNCYYAVGTAADDGSYTYGTPVALKGAQSLSLEAQGENVPVYADDIEYATVNGNSGYSGDLGLVLVPDDFKAAVLNEITDTNSVIYEDADAEIVHFALLFEFSGDAKKTRHVLYNCTCTRPAVASNTIGETKEPQTESLTITSKPVYNSSVDKNVTKAKCVHGDTKYATWFESVYQPVASA